MIRKVYLMVLLLVASMATAYGDEQKDVKLNTDDKQAMVELSYCNIFLEIENVDQYGKVTVSVAMENTGETNELLLFDRGYDESTLKEMQPPIVYDDIFGGSKGHRTIEACEGIEQNFHISPSYKEMVLSLSVEEGKTAVCRLPIYIAQYQTKKKFIFIKKEQLVMLEKQVVELNIDVEIRPNAAYQELADSCAALLSELDGVMFCTNKKHKPSLYMQRKVYLDRIEAYTERINEMIKQNGWMPTHKMYKLCEGLKQELKQINLDEKEGDCGKHKVYYTHRCRYCNLSLQQIYHKLDDYYQRIYSSSDRSAVKEQVIGDVKALYNCCVDKCCRSHSRQWSKSEYKSKITDRYNRINDF